MAAEPSRGSFKKAGLVFSALFIVILSLCFIGAAWFMFSSFFSAAPRVAMNPSLVIPQRSSASLVIASTIDENGADADRAEYKPLTDYLSAHLGSAGITSVEYQPFNDAADIALAIRQGRADVVIDSVFPVYVVDDLTGAQPILDRWKGGVEEYRTIIFTPQSSTIRTLDDLKGKIIAFDSPNSTAGYFLPKAELVAKGYTLTEKHSPADAVAPGEIGYVFVHGGVYQDVKDGTVVAGAESELEVDAHFGSDIAQYRTVFATHRVPRFLVAVRKDLNPAVAQALNAALLSMSSSSEGVAALHAFADTAKFTPLTSTSTAYGVVGMLTNLVESEIVQQ